MATVAGRVVIDLMAKTGQFSSGMRNAQKDLQKFSGNAKSTLSSLSSLAIPGGLAFGFMESIREVERFNQALRRSLAIMEGVTPRLRKELAATARAMAFDSQFSATQLAEAYKFLAAAGLNAEKSMKALPVVARFAQAGQFDLALATDLLTDAQSALGMQSQDTATHLRNMEVVSDALVAGYSIANASVQQFSEAITNGAGVAARQLGLDLNEVIALTAVFADQGLAKGVEAGTAIGIVLRDLQTASLNNAKAFKQAGIEVFDAGGEFRGVIPVLKDMEKAFDGLSDKSKKELFADLGFTDKSVKYTQALLGTSDAMQRYLDKAKEMGGVSRRVAEENLTPLEKAMNKLRAVFQSFAQQVGSPVINGLSKMIELVVKLSRVLVPLVAGILAVKFATKAWAMATKGAVAAQLLLTGAKGGLAAVVKLGIGVGAAYLALEQMNEVFKEIENKDLSDVLPKELTNALKVATGNAPASDLIDGKSSGPLSNIGGVGATNINSVEGFNNLQRAIQGNRQQELELEKQQKQALDNAVSELRQIRRLLDQPSTEIEFA